MTASPDRRFATVENDAVHRLDGSLRIAFGAHLDEREAAGAAGVAVQHELDLPDLAVVLTEFTRERVFGGLEGEIANVESCTQWISNW